MILRRAPVALGAIVAEAVIQMIVSEPVVLHMAVSASALLTMDIHCTKPTFRTTRSL
jgi:hypothetical protein